jgi:integrase/recombinase XerD
MRATRSIRQASGSQRDVQILAGHKSIETTQRYIETGTEAKRNLVKLV